MTPARDPKQETTTEQSKWTKKPQETWREMKGAPQEEQERRKTEREADNLKKLKASLPWTAHMQGAQTPGNRGGCDEECEWMIYGWEDDMKPCGRPCDSISHQKGWHECKGHREGTRSMDQSSEDRREELRNQKNPPTRQIPFQLEGRIIEIPMEDGDNVKEATRYVAQYCRTWVVARVRTC